MSINILKITKKITKKHPEWKTLCRKLRINEEIVEDGNFSLKTSNYDYKNLELIERHDTKIIWTEITAIGEECSIELQNMVEFDKDGNFVCGIMNNFMGRFMNMDKGSLEEIFYQAKDKFSKIGYWDIISNSIDNSILKGFSIPNIEKNKNKNGFWCDFD